MKESIQNIVNENIAEAKQQYIAVADPYKYIAIDPLQVEYHCRKSVRTRRKYGSKILNWGKVMRGNWDINIPEESNTRRLAEVLEVHFFQGVPYEDLVLADGASLYERKLRVIEKRGRVDGCRNVDELDQRYRRLDRLFDQISSEGRLRTAEERGAGPSDDLYVSIGRDGQFYLSLGGSHRLAIAQLLKLPSIPVRVMIRHTFWQERRDQFAEDELSNQEHLHPDLLDI